MGGWLGEKSPRPAARLFGSPKPRFDAVSQLGVNQQSEARNFYPAQGEIDQLQKAALDRLTAAITADRRLSMWRSSRLR